MTRTKCNVNQAPCPAHALSIRYLSLKAVSMHIAYQSCLAFRSSMTDACACHPAFFGTLVSSGELSDRSRQLAEDLYRSMEHDDNVPTIRGKFHLKIRTSRAGAKIQLEPMKAYQRGVPVSSEPTVSDGSPPRSRQRTSSPPPSSTNASASASTTAPAPSSASASTSETMPPTLRYLTIYDYDSDEVFN